MGRVVNVLDLVFDLLLEGRLLLLQSIESI